MVKTSKIPLISIILININIIIGAGLFVNPRPLAMLAGRWGFVSYLVGGLIILPLVTCLSQLARKHPKSGGLYVYSQTYLTPFAGFLSGWGYFLGKATSAGFLCYKFVQFFQGIIPQLNIMPALPLTIIILYLLSALNILGAHIGGKIQWLFIALKTIPISFVIVTGLYKILFNSHAPVMMSKLSQFHSTLPIAIFALVGFEATCSIAHMIKNPQKNIRRAMLISSMSVALIAALFQFCMYSVLGETLAQSSTPLLVYGLSIFHSMPLIAQLINGCVFLSIIGGAFGMLTSNCWNFHALCQNKHFPFHNHLTKVTQSGVPWTALLVESSISSLILLISVHQIALQNMAVFAMFVSYFFNTISAYKAFSRGSKKTLHPLIPAVALVGCLSVIGLCIGKIMTIGISYSFLIVMICGIVLERYYTRFSRA